MAEQKTFQLRPATHADALAITRIYNAAIEATSAIMWHDPKPTAYWGDRLLITRPAQYPVWVATQGEGNAEQVIGFSALGAYDALCGYVDVAEWSLYIDTDFRGQGVGRALSQTILQAGKNAGLRSVLSRVTAGNAASIALHQSLGFRLVGTLEKLGEKFGQHHDVLMYQLRC